ncbi:MAG: phosphotransferase family protein [Candidatus Actinomarina sp.]|tara:strand:- start:344 stop:1360 length:1017 start_codon:yes stop_codon:yes gene_type:complete
MDFFSEKLKKYISSVVDISEDFNFEQFKVGRSNITFKIFDDANSFVLRRPPFGLKLESAHNMGREYKILKVLSENGLRVPKPMYLYNKKELSVDDFYIMEFIEGETIANNQIADEFNEIQKNTITESFIKALSEIHNFDVISSELNDLGKHEDYVERQINRWNKQFQSQKVREIKELESATKLLLDNIPSQQTVGIVHGDYRLDNVRVKDNQVAAVLDWELCTLGDPLADMGTVVASWNTKQEKDSPFIYSPTLSGGFPTRKDVIELYLNNSDLDLSDIEFYARLSFWKHAMIMEGVYIRYSMGSYGKTNENEIESFKNSTIKFANKAANKNLLEEII